MNKEELRSIFFEILTALIGDIEFKGNHDFFNFASGMNLLSSAFGFITEFESCEIDDLLVQLFECDNSDLFMICKSNLIESLKNELK